MIAETATATVAGGASKSFSRGAAAAILGSADRTARKITTSVGSILVSTADDAQIWPTITRANAPQDGRESVVKCAVKT